MTLARLLLFFMSMPAVLSFMSNMPAVSQQRYRTSLRMASNDINRSTSRDSFLRQGAVGLGGVFGLLGLSSPASAGFFDKDLLELEQVPVRTVIGKTRTVTWKEVAPAIEAMRTEAREHFASTGAKGGRELSSFLNQTAEGVDVLVGVEVSDPKGSPAISDGFTANVVAPPGKYMRDDHNGKPGVAPWFTFMGRLTKEGYKFADEGGSMSMFEVYSGTGGQETVSMYTTVYPAK